MSYQVLARKYRPQSFDDIIGQGHVSTTLKNALRSGKVAHAYLFSGPRGVGKTTTARLLAKALNCEKGPTSTPCNTCDSCLRIAQGQEMVDVLEIDAASNRGIEEIRELRDNVRYAPARSRYKVYIVDEAHQITHDAFNAFLKTLEEPPPHAVFILATTEHQKIPATILSRCQLFRFKRVTVEEITARLQKILASEKIVAEPAALVRLARAAGGSVRDALSLLDQALAYTPDHLTAKQVEMLLGFLPDEFLQGFASALLERKPAGIIEWTRQLAEEGWELPQFVRDFREFLRQTLVEQLSNGASGHRSVDDAPKGSSPAPRLSDAPTLTLAGRPATLAEVLHMIKVMGQCLDDMRWNDNPQLVLELYSLRLTQPFVDIGELLRRIEHLEATPEKSASLGASEPRSVGASPLPASPTLRRPDASSNLSPKSPSSPIFPTGEGVAKAAFFDAPTPRRSDAPAVDAPMPRRSDAPAVDAPMPRRSDAPAVDAPMPRCSDAPAVDTPAPRRSDAPAVEPSLLWKQFLAELWKRPAVAAQMERAFLKSATATEWVIAFPDKFSLDSTQRVQPFLMEMLAKVTGAAVRLTSVLDAGDRRETAPMAVSVPGMGPARPSGSEDPAVQKVLDVFKGRIRESPPEGESR